MFSVLIMRFSLQTVNSRAVRMLLVVIFLLESDHVSAYDDAVNMNSIVTAWRGREAQVSSLDFSWHGSEFQSGMARRGGRGATRRESERQDFSFEHRMRFVVDSGDRVRLEYHGKEWSPAKGEPVAKDMIDIHERETRHLFFPHGTIGFPNAHITESNESVIARDVRLLPLLMNYRPFHQTLGWFDPARLKLTDQRGVVDGRSCLVLRHTNQSAGTDETVWVDPARSFIPLRCWIAQNGRTTFDIEIAYTANQEHGWIPTSWSNTWLDERGDIINSKSSIVDDHKINQPVAAELFKIEYPAGTWVHDYLTDEEYILRAEGERRPILPGEFNGRNYEQLLRSDPPRNGPSKRVLMLAVSTVLFIALVIAVWRRKA